MKLSKKIMLFEEFAQVKSSEVVAAVPTSLTVDVKQSTIRTEIVNDVDSIINRLEDLANNLNSDTEVAETNENLVTEAASAVDQILSAELYMIPLVAAGIVAGSAAGTGILIKRAITKMKIKSKFKKTVLKNKLAAAKMELYLKDLRSKEVDDKAKDKIESFKKKIDDLNSVADEVYDALSQKYDKYKDFLASLNSELKLQTAEMMLGSKSLTDAEKQKFKDQYDNAEKTLNKKVETIAQDQKELKNKVKNASPEEQNRFKQEQQKLKDKIKEEEDAKKNSKEGKLKRVEDLIKKEEEKIASGDKGTQEIKDKIKKYEDAIKDLQASKDKKSTDKISIIQAALNSEKKKLEDAGGDSEKLKKLKELRDKIAAKESWDLTDVGVLLIECELDEFEIEELI